MQAFLAAAAMRNFCIYNSAPAFFQQLGTVMGLMDVLGQMHLHMRCGNSCRRSSLTSHSLNLTTMLSVQSELDRFFLGRERETLHLFQPPRADQMPDPLQGQD